MNLFAMLAEQAVAADPTPAAEPQVSLLALVLLLAAVAAPAWIYVAGRFVRQQAPLQYEGRRPVPWIGADVLAVCLLSFLWQLFPLLALRWQGFELPHDGRLQPDSETTALIAQVIAGIGSLGIAILWLVVRAGATVETLGCSLRAWRRDLTSGLVAAVFIIPPVLAVQSVAQHLLPSEHPLITVIKQHHEMFPVIAVLAVLTAPLLEEFLFRVVLQGWLEKVERSLRRSAPESLRLPRGVVPVLLSSLAFAAAHFGHGADAVPLFIFALVLGYLYRQTHRLWPSLVLHMTLNALTTLLLWAMLSK